MKKPLLIAICILLAFTSCKKSSDVPANTISATVDGVDESFNTNTNAQLGTAIALNSVLNIAGSSASGTGADIIGMTIESNGTIVKGSYSNSAVNNSTFTSMLYTKGPFLLSDPNIYSSGVNGNYPTTITITSMINTNIQGTFSGKLLFKDGTTVKSVTNGKFNLDIDK